MKRGHFKMKVGDEASASASGGSKPFKKKMTMMMKKNKSRMGGGKGLSLEAFANAKTGSTDYNPSLIIIAAACQRVSFCLIKHHLLESLKQQKEREFYKNAKLVHKYKKSLKQQHPLEDHPPLPATFEDINECELDIKKKKKNKSLQSLRQEYEKRCEEEEKARIEREAMLKAKKEEQVKAEARRKELRQKMFKRTRSGQPVMKYRIEHALQGILKSSE
ncbi:hypothetical protein QJS10_CPB04g00719 [Acorus calamus]|uniref:Uncharacterized protein n=1 Tax=Acorus calamus TaxID=4465 RepID=A0AAV9F424_ACOCL|nr:hypothetical protein QJS10_CPB04g00719 [Acorus calamus]